MSTIPNYANPTTAESSFRELLPDLENLGINRKKFLSMFKELVNELHKARRVSCHRNLFERGSVVDHHFRVRVIKDGIRNPLTRAQFNKVNRLKVPYVETFDAVIIPLKTVGMPKGRLAISPEAGRMELQCRLSGHSEWLCYPVTKGTFWEVYHTILNPM